MMKKILLILSLPVLALTFGSCARSEGDELYRASKHLEHHIYRPYVQLDTLHKEIDWFFFDLDERNPDNWP